MFTGLVEAKGRLRAASPRSVGDDASASVRCLEVETPFVGEQTPSLGDSVAVQGVCLTVTERCPHSGVLAFEVAAESQRRTTLGALEVGALVHIERALRFGSRLGGHLVSGHVDGRAQVVTSKADGGSWLLVIEPPQAVLDLSMAQGAITLDGVSLTINAITKTTLSVGLVPHTLQATSLGQLRAGDWVNCEADVLARYVARLLPHPRASSLDDPDAHS